MKKIKYILPLFLLTGCTGTQFVEQQSETLSEGVYATKDSIDVGRIDLASDYSNNVVKIVNPPKKRITIKPLLSKNNDANTVLPQNLQTQKVVYVDSTDYDQLEQLQADNTQLQNDLSNAQQYSKQAATQAIKDKQVLNDLLIDDNAQKAKIANYEKSVFYKAYEWYVWLSWVAPIVIFVLIIGLIVLCAFAPSAALLIGEALINVYTVVSTFISWVYSKL